jgi:outer membrane protein OmpA-like peptidoglycan-associated protein
MNKFLIGLGTLALCASAAFAQGQAPVININVSRTIQAVNYRAKGSTHIDFRGTPLLPMAKGEAKMESKPAGITIDATFENLSPATQFGSVYLTYVLWAISPDGLANNLGQLTLDGSRGKLQVTTHLQTFGLILTAEPYFAVSAPSERVVLENIVRADTKGRVDAVDAKYDLLKRGHYADGNFAPLDNAGGVSLDLLEARNAMRIAKWRGADTYAKESWDKAQASMSRAEDFNTRQERKAAPAVAREAVQGYEDALTISMKRQDDERLAQERNASAQSIADAKAAQDAEAQRRAEAEKQKLTAQLGAAQDAQARAEAEKAQADAEKQAAMAHSQAAEADKAKSDAERQAALAQSQAADAQRDAADAQNQKNIAQANEQTAKDQAEQARLATAKAEQAQAELRATLLQQFSLILETRDTVRGLVVNLGDVLFTTSKYDLRPEARERLAKLAGIILAHPGLSLAGEGYTDSQGSDSFNQTLSENRSASVRNYLISQGLNAGSITTAGFGKSQPVADNGTAAGRQLNRRVEIVISGEVIGVKIGVKAVPVGGQQ